MVSPVSSKVGNFASKLTSPTFQLVVSTCVPPKTFSVHKAVLEAGCPYFQTLFNTRLPTKEVAENKLILDSAVDFEDAWGMVIDYLYLGDDGLKGRRLEGLASGSEPAMAEELLFNARVYVLALKLCMEELKLHAAKRAHQLLAGLYGFSTLSATELQRLVEIVYPNTPDSDEEKGQSADENTQISCDPMRELLAKYAASLLTKFRGTQEFTDLVLDWSEFSRDMLLYTENGARVVLHTGGRVEAQRGGPIMRARYNGPWGLGRSAYSF